MHRVERLTWIDRHLGAVLCFLLTCVRRVADIFGRRRMAPEDVRTVLFVKLMEMGGTVLACPAFQEARRRFPNARLMLLTFRETRPVVEFLGAFRPEDVVEIDAGGVLSLLRSLPRALRRLRGERVDLAVDLDFYSRASALLCYLSGATERVGFHRFRGEGLYRGRLFTREVAYNPYLHVSQLLLALVRSAFTEDPEQQPLFKEPPPPVETLEVPRFEPAPAEREALATKVHAAGWPADRPPLVLINPNTQDVLPLRRWPMDRYESLVRRLLQEHAEVCVAVVGLTTERESAAKLVRRIGDPRVFSLAGETGFRELLALFHLACVIVSSDSGPPHFAAMTPIGIVSLFGTETPTLYHPLSPRNRSMYAGLACSPCIHVHNNRLSTCTRNLCMEAITPEEVAREVGEMLERVLGKKPG